MCNKFLALGCVAFLVLMGASSGPALSATLNAEQEEICLIGALEFLLPEQAPPPITGFFYTPAEEGLQQMINDFQNAEKSIHYIIFNETDIKVAQALVDAKAKGFDVQVIHDVGNWEKNLANNEPATLLLQKAGIVTPSSIGFDITHGKAAAIDSGTKKQAVWITSRNATPTYPSQRDAGVKTNDPLVIQDFEAIFAADIQNAKTGGTFTPPLKSNWIVVSPVNSEPKLVSLIQAAAPDTVMNATSENWGNPGIQNALIANLARGVQVNVIGPLQDLNVNPQFNYPYLQQLQKAGINAMGMPGPGTPQIPYMHQKFIAVKTVNGWMAYLGSVNLSRSSASTIAHFKPPAKPSREIGLIFMDPPAIKQLNANFASDAAVTTQDLSVPAPVPPASN